MKLILNLFQDYHIGTKRQMSPVKNANIKRLDTTPGSYSESVDSATASANLSRSISHNILAPSPDRYIDNTEIQDKIKTAIKF